MITYEEFEKVDIRTGTITQVEAFPEARKPAYKLWIDFGGELGIKKSSAQITSNYAPQELLHKQVLAVVNFPTKQIGPFQSEVLTLGISNEEGNIILVEPERKVPNGKKLH